MEDLSGAVEELVAIGAPLALAGGDLPGEHETTGGTRAMASTGRVVRITSATIPSDALVVVAITWNR